MQDLVKRFKMFALRIIRLYSALPKNTVSDVIGKQFLRSSLSIGAHYHEAIYARSNDEFIAKIDLCLQELSETSYWIDLIVLAEVMKREKIKLLQDEIKNLKLFL